MSVSNSLFTVREDVPLADRGPTTDGASLIYDKDGHISQLVFKPMSSHRLTLGDEGLCLTSIAEWAFGIPADDWDRGIQTYSLDDQHSGEAMVTLASRALSGDGASKEKGLSYDVRLTSGDPTTNYCNFEADETGHLSFVGLVRPRGITPRHHG
jgi:hypothetical protein